MSTSETPEIRVRAAGIADADRLLDWRNDPQSRSMSLSNDLITREQHLDWYAATLASAARVILIAEDAATGEPVGMCRFDIEDDGTAEVSINVAPGRRGGGVGSAVLAAALEAFGRSHPEVPSIAALIRVENVASTRLFERAGFRRVEETDGVGRFVRELSV